MYYDIICMSIIKHGGWFLSGTGTLHIDSATIVQKLMLACL